MKTIALIFPHQLYQQHPALKQKPDLVVLIEDSLFFSDPHHPAHMHKQKLWLHRASMKRYAAELEAQGHQVRYLDYDEKQPLLGAQLSKLGKAKKSFISLEPSDFLLEKRLRRFCVASVSELTLLPSPGFLNTQLENQEYRAGKKRWFMADYYKFQRRRLDVLMEDGEPRGGQWSFDDENRKKLPKKLLGTIPSLLKLPRDAIDEEAREYVLQRFAKNPGSLAELYYPSSTKAARKWLKLFLQQRFEQFGAYEDAIVEGESWLWHSVLSPALNSGLLTPQEVLKAAVDYEQKHEVPLNSLEGFVRQILGWREFMRATYEDLGVQMRTSNHWQHKRKMPRSFYDGTTGIAPIDDAIRRTLETGYCHHIERLMVLGGFFFLCEIDPKEIYTWFMELFVDSYDWVMVPNVYAMSQHADGGLITTKPYFSGSSYVRKMSHYKKEAWCDVWDGLYWRWIDNHKDELAKNPRWAMMCAAARKMDPEKMQAHHQQAQEFFKQLE